MDAKTERMKELVELLNQASKAYYQQDTEIMSNLEYDALYDELAALEQETGLILSKSPTQNVGYEIISELPKERIRPQCYLWTRQKVLRIWQRGWVIKQESCRGRWMD